MTYKENQKIWIASALGHCVSAAVITKVGDCGFTVIGEKDCNDMAIRKSNKCWMTGELSTMTLAQSVKSWQENQIGVFQGLPVLFWGMFKPDLIPDDFIVVDDFDQLETATKAAA